MTTKENTECPTPRVGKLHTMAAVREEQARVYREARIGNVKPADATKLTYMLVHLRETIEVTALEAKLTEIEDAMNG